MGIVFGTEPNEKELVENTSITTKPKRSAKQIFCILLFTIIFIVVISFLVIKIAQNLNLLDIYNFANNGLSFALVILSSLLCLSYLFTFIFHKKENKSLSFLTDITLKNLSYSTRRIIGIFIHLIIISLIVFGNSWFVVNVLKYDDIRVKPKGVYCYYVEAINEKGKVYLAPAEVHKKNRNCYTIEVIRFSNGDSMYLDECEEFKFGDSINYNDKPSYDEVKQAVIEGNVNFENNDEWKIKLTNYKTYHRRIEETKISFSFTEVLSLILVLQQIFTIFLHMKFLAKESNDD